MLSKRRVNPYSVMHVVVVQIFIANRHPRHMEPAVKCFVHAFVQSCLHGSPMHTWCCCHQERLHVICNLEYVL